MQFKRSLIPFIRRISLFTIFLMLILSPLVQLIRTFRQDPYPYPYSPLIQNQSINQFIKIFDHSARETLDPFYNFITGGSYISNFYFIKISEPLTITNHFISSLPNISEWSIPLLTTTVLTMLIYLFLGRVFCGYICPMSVITNLNQKFQKKFLKRKNSFYRSHLSSYLQNYKWIYFLIFLFIFFNPLILQYILPPAIMQHMVSDYILYGGITLWMSVFIVLIVYELYRPGDFCKHLCPTGVFLSFASSFKLLKLAHNQLECPTGCTKCIDICWLGLNPKGDKIGEAACDFCNRCTSVCPVQRIVPKKSKLNFKFIFPILLFIITPNVMANKWSEKEDYHLSIKEMTIYENELSFSHQKDKYRVMYSLVSEPKDDETDNQNVSLYIHLTKNKKLFQSPVHINILPQKIVCQFDEYNAPISIGKRSLYRCTYSFNFKPLTYAVLKIKDIAREIKLPIIYSRRH